MDEEMRKNTKNAALVEGENGASPGENRGKSTSTDTQASLEAERGSDEKERAAPAPDSQNRESKAFTDPQRLQRSRLMSQKALENVH